MRSCRGKGSQGDAACRWEVLLGKHARVSISSRGMRSCTAGAAREMQRRIGSLAGRATAAKRSKNPTNDPQEHHGCTIPPSATAAACWPVDGHTSQLRSTQRKVHAPICIPTATPCTSSFLPHLLIGHEDDGCAGQLRGTQHPVQSSARLLKTGLAGRVDDVDDRMALVVVLVPDGLKPCLAAWEGAGREESRVGEMNRWRWTEDG